ncbi:hypothetical protein IAG44_24560 [Streptomyces roseirectus]|uniref:Uncharacterized protein n=1 Tax=Streptomyces roseirectus TaxID=2768066 RepID=A0A7H0IHK9_9ACTN|nr:hypothetical protein [Streptomyces roseirectus]QNP72275.1 hypothetical protein IAG44_24560 [Streptomyces roseirectus]
MTVLYVFGFPPFKEVREIKAGEVCGSLGDAARAGAALREVLPKKSEYSSRDDVTASRVDEMDSSYGTYCFVYGDGKQVAVARAELVEYENTDQWVKEVVEQLVPASSLTPFEAGDRAVASSRIAAIYSPCLSRGANRYLSVHVHLKEKGDAGDSELRSGLIELAENATVYAHSRARCDLPSKVNAAS